MARRRRQDLDLFQATARVPQHVVYRSFPHETVVLNLKTGRYHGLNPTAGTMLTELEKGETIHAVAARLAELYERPLGEIERDLLELCRDFLQRGLIEFTGPDGRVLEATGTDDAG